MNKFEKNFLYKLINKNKSEYKELDYRKAYTTETREFVAKKYSDDIKLFNYEKIKFVEHPIFGLNINK